jgi:mono/diheme cytochrome c family protein
MRALGIICGFVLIVSVIISCQSEQDVNFNRYYSAGATVYQTHCQNCHGDKGQGLAALIPPLTDHDYLKRNKQQLACLLKLGTDSKLIINGKEFQDQMLPADLSPIEAAQVITYITNSFGNKLGLTDNDEVQRDLGKCK